MSSNVKPPMSLPSIGFVNGIFNSRLQTAAESAKEFEKEVGFYMNRNNVNREEAVKIVKNLRRLGL